MAESCFKSSAIDGFVFRGELWRSRNTRSVQLLAGFPCFMMGIFHTLKPANHKSDLAPCKGRPAAYFEELLNPLPFMLQSGVARARVKLSQVMDSYGDKCF
jgi:hypothetical protein